MPSYTVSAPLLIIKDQSGRNHHTYFGGVVHYLNDEQREHFLRLGLVKEHQTAAEAAEAVSEIEAPVEALMLKPKNTAPHAEWVKFGVGKGNAEAELKGMSKQDLIELLDEF